MDRKEQPLAGEGTERKAAGEKGAFLFALDGTLLNTLEDIADSMNHALSSVGLPPWETAAFRYLVGNGAQILAERAVREHDEWTDRVLEIYQREYDARLMNKTRPYPGMTETLEELTRRGIPLCVLSNKPDANTREIIAHYFPEIPFAHVQGQLPGVPRKPDPAAALAIAREIGVLPERFLYVGDTSVDMECARRAGMRAIGALWGFRTRTELEGSGAACLVRRPEELLEL